MAKCLQCGKRGLFLKVNGLGLCKSCEAARRAESEREIERQRMIDMAEAQRVRLKAEAEAKEKQRAIDLAKPYTPDDMYHGLCLAYSYTEVGFYCPDDLRAKAQSIPPRQVLELKPDPENEYDSKAIAIYSGHTKLGYLYKGKLRDMVRDFLKADNKDFVVVSRYWDTVPALDLFFYVSFRSLLLMMKKDPDFQEYTLTANKNQDMQDAISSCEVGERVEISQDFEKDRYVVTSVDDIGYLPASASKYIEAHERIDARISSITENENEKYTVRVMMIPIREIPQSEQ